MPLFTISAVASKAVNALLLNNVAKTRIKSRSGHYLFAAVTSVVACAFIICIAGGIPEVDSHDVFHGIILGILAIGEEFFMLSALECGGMAPTMMAAFMAIMIPRILSPILWGRAFGVRDIIGIIVALLCVALITNKKNTEQLDEHEAHEFTHWRKYAIILLIITAMVEIEEKTHAMTSASEEHLAYYFVAFLTGIILAGTLFLIRFKGKSEPTYFKYDFKFILIFLVCGIFKALIYILIGLAAAELSEEMVVMFNNCITLVIVALVDRFAYHNEYTKYQYLAILLAIAAVIILV